MWYFIHARDTVDSLQKRLQARPDHVARLHELQDQGRLLTAGPLPAIDAEDPGPAGFSGSMLVVAFDSLEAAREWAGADPYLAAGVYESVDVYPYKAAFPS
jgi:uncharacterized protein YciI